MIEDKPYNNLVEQSKYLFLTTSGEFYAEEEDEKAGIDLNQHVGSMFSTQPVFGYPMMKFSDSESDQDLHSSTNSQQWNRLVGNVTNRYNLFFKFLRLTCN